VTDPYASFLMAGERSGDTVVEVVRRDGNSTILRAMGLSSNNLQPVVVDLRKHIGQEIFIRLFDGSEHGRVSFDDFRFHEIKPEVSPSSIRLEAGKTVDVLKLIDIERDSRTGKWHWGEGGALAGEGWRLLRLPVTIPPEYDLAMTLEGNAQAGEVQVILPMQDSQAELVVDGWGKTISGLRLVDGKGGDANETSRPGMFLHSGRPNHLLCQVRAGSITVICNGATVIDWHGDSAQLSLPFGTLAGCDGLLLGDLVGYRLSQLAITPVGAPTGSVTADGTKAPPPRAKGGDVKEEKLAVKPVVTAREVAQLKHHTGAVARVVFHRALPLLVSTGMDGRVVRWDLDKDNTPTELHKFRWEVWTAKFSPDGELLAFADRWNGETEVIF
jgi:hypothetical protein